MTRRKAVWSLILAALVGATCLVPAFTQDAGRSGQEQDRDRDRRGQDRDREGDRRRRGGGNEEDFRRRIEEFRRRSSERLRDALGATAEEWQIIEPRIEAVREAQSQLRGGERAFFEILSRLSGSDSGGDRGGFGRGGPGRGGPGRGGSGGFGGRRGPGGRDGDRQESEVGRKTAALGEILQRKEASPEQIKRALGDLRAARKKSERDLAQAQGKLREVLTLRQEAILVVMRTLD